MMAVPKTQIGRFLLVGFLLASVGAPAWVWLQDAPFSPAEWHGYTINRDDVITYNNGKPVQYVMDTWLGAGAVSSELRRQADRCDPARIGSSIVGREYRAVTLCNTAALGEDEFGVTSRLFEGEVDSMYDRYYFEWAWRIGGRLAALFAAVIALAGTAWTVRWVRSGQST